MNFTSFITGQSSRFPREDFLRIFPFSFATFNERKSAKSMTSFNCGSGSWLAICCSFNGETFIFFSYKFDFVMIEFTVKSTQRGQAATKQEKGLGDIKMLWQDDGGKMI
jgi:hypothetical protein